MNLIAFSSNNSSAILQINTLRTFQAFNKICVILCELIYCTQLKCFFFFSQHLFSKSLPIQHVRLIQSSVIEVNGCVKLLGDGKAIPSVIEYVS